VPEALSDAATVEREERAYLLLVFYYYIYTNFILRRRSKREDIMVWILFVNTRRKLGIHARTLGAILSRGAQADARGTTQVLGCGGQAVAGGTFLSQVLDRDRGAQGDARGATQVLDRGGQAAPYAQRQGTPRGDVHSKSWRLCRSSAARNHVFAVVAPPAHAAQSLGVASGVDAPLKTCAHVLDRGVKGCAQTAACGDATLPHQEKNTRQMSRRT
jgi:hypothetical protein